MNTRIKQLKVEVKDSQVRAWAAKNNIPVGDRGVVSAKVRAMYEAGGNPRAKPYAVSLVFTDPAGDEVSATFRHPQLSESIKQAQEWIQDLTRYWEDPESGDDYPENLAEMADYFPQPSHNPL